MTMSVNVTAGLDPQVMAVLNRLVRAYEATAAGMKPAEVSELRAQLTALEARLHGLRLDHQVLVSRVDSKGP